jgi:hypothetical protein
MSDGIRSPWLSSALAVHSPAVMSRAVQLAPKTIAKWFAAAAFGIAGWILAAPLAFSSGPIGRPPPLYTPMVRLLESGIGGPFRWYFSVCGVEICYGDSRCKHLHGGTANKPVEATQPRSEVSHDQ